jgi:uncharacterized membrane-anchored protein
MIGERTSSNFFRVLFFDWGLESYFVHEGKGRTIEKQVNIVSAVVSLDFTVSSVLKELLINDETLEFE